MTNETIQIETMAIITELAQILARGYLRRQARTRSGKSPKPAKTPQNLAEKGLDVRAKQSDESCAVNARRTP